jgi:hypothetical protein
VRRPARRFLRGWLWSLALSLAIGLAIGTCVRRRAEQPARFIGWQASAPPAG